LPSAAALEAERLKRNLSSFVKAAWHLVEPATPLVWSWHLEAICLHLQAVTEGRIRKLIINVPPRTGKSTIVSVLWPCWEWARNPAVRMMFASYAQQLSLRDSVRRRLVIQSEWFQERWPNVKLSGDQNVKHEFQNISLGYMVATSTGGTVTGRGGDRLVLDDPNDATQMESEVQRESALTWFDLQWSTRGNNPATYCEVIIQQRTHEQDITGHALRQGEWVHLKLPMEFSGQACSTSIGWKDPRTELGALLDPVRFNIGSVNNLKKRLGPYGASGQLQQEPSPSEGGIIKRAWIRAYEQKDKLITFPGRYPLDDIYTINPSDCLRFATVDLAVTKKDNDKADPDYTVIAAWCVFLSHRGPLIALLDLFRDRIEGPDISKHIKAMHVHWKFQFVAVEQIAGFIALGQQFKRDGLPIRDIGNKEDSFLRIESDKQARAYGATPLMADARFFVPTYAPWLGEYIKELTVFPNYGHDDQVDVTSSAVAIAEKIKLGNLEKANAPLQKSAQRYNSRESDSASDNPYNLMRLNEP
jgi:predicted phage terminase large subunit-like protein